MLVSSIRSNFILWYSSRFFISNDFKHFIWYFPVFSLNSHTSNFAFYSSGRYWCFGYQRLCQNQKTSTNRVARYFNDSSSTNQTPRISCSSSSGNFNRFQFVKSQIQDLTKIDKNQQKFPSFILFVSFFVAFSHLF